LVAVVEVIVVDGLIVVPVVFEVDAVPAPEDDLEDDAALSPEDSFEFGKALGFVEFLPVSFGVTFDSGFLGPPVGGLVVCEGFVACLFASPGFVVAVAPSSCADFFAVVSTLGRSTSFVLNGATEPLETSVFVFAADFTAGVPSGAILGECSTRLPCAKSAVGFSGSASGWLARVESMACLGSESGWTLCSESVVILSTGSGWLPRVESVVVFSVSRSGWLPCVESAVTFLGSGSGWLPRVESTTVFPCWSTSTELTVNTSDDSPGCRGDSGIGSLANSCRAALLPSSGEAMADLSGTVEMDSVSVSLLIRRLEILDSPLWSLRSPIRPSFSTATKLVLTLDRGRGEPVPCAPTWLGVETPDVLPLSGGLVSSLTSNMARRFLTWLIAAFGRGVCKLGAIEGSSETNHLVVENQDEAVGP
jgi:hypothetical protein